MFLSKRSGGSGQLVQQDPRGGDLVLVRLFGNKRQFDLLQRDPFAHSELPVQRRPTLVGKACPRQRRTLPPGVERSFELGQTDRLGKKRLHSRSEEHTSELQSLMRSSYDVFCLH